MTDYLGSKRFWEEYQAACDQYPWAVIVTTTGTNDTCWLTYPATDRTCLRPSLSYLNHDASFTRTVTTTAPTQTHPLALS